MNEIQFERTGDGGVRVSLVVDGDVQEIAPLTAEQWAQTVVSVADTRWADDEQGPGLVTLVQDLHAGVPAGSEFACAMSAPVAGDPSRRAEGIQATATPEDARVLAGIINGRDDGTEGKPVRRSVFAWVDA